MATIGITGAAGYIGSKLCSEIQKDYDIVPVDSFYRGQIREIHGTKIIKADIRDRKALSVLQDVDAVVHLAAISDVGECEQNKDLAFEVNVLGTQNIAFICYSKGIPLIFPSSMTIFGNLEYTPVDEQHPRNPRSFYGLTKVLGEKGIATFSKGNFPSYILIKSNVYGAHEIDGIKIKKETVINKFVGKAAKNEDLTIFEPGTQPKNFLHITDAVTAYKKAVKSILADEEKKTKVFCLGSWETLTVLELGNLVKNLAEKKGYHPSVVLVKNPRTGEPDKTFNVEPSKIQAELGFTPLYTLEKGIEEMLGEAAL